jgi:hypothetical protein
MVFGRICAVGVLGLAACGGEFVEPKPEAPNVVLTSNLVVADPPGHDFEGETEVRLEAPGSQDMTIYYTLDGSPATGTDALEYGGPIRLTETTLLNFIARDPRLVWSEPRSELYVAQTEPTPVRDVARALVLSRDLVFFAWDPGDDSPMRETIELRASGTEPVHIFRIALGLNPRGQMFWESGAFRIVSGTDPITLAPGESTTLTIVYEPTATLRSAAVLISSDQEMTGGDQLIELWGRVNPW